MGEIKEKLDSLLEALYSLNRYLYFRDNDRHKMENDKDMVYKTSVLTLRNNGENVVVVIKYSISGTTIERYSVKHLLNEEFEVDEQTLKREAELFKEPTQF